MLFEYQRNGFHLFCFRLQSVPGLVAVDRLYTSPLDLLSPDENNYIATFPSEARHRQWLSCRIMAKLMLRQVFHEKFDYPDITIRSRNEEGRQTAPVLLVRGERLPYIASFSHLAEAAVVALCPRTEAIALGTDLVKNNSVSPIIVRGFFTEREKTLLNGPNHLSPDDIWAAKETTYKARCLDKGFAPRRIEIVSPLVGETVNTRMAHDQNESVILSQMVHLVAIADYRLGFCLIQDNNHHAP